MREKIDQNTEMNQDEEYFSLIARNVLYKTTDLVFLPTAMVARRAPSSVKRPFLGQKWLLNSLKKF